ncbi:MAG: ABC transporter ATP-binding protein [Chloroflexi bacterium]|nr:ABC transporter ATP-binding protein [Chloroflexota bacterium]
MSDLAIRVEGLGKKYHIGSAQKSYSTLRDTLSTAFVAPFVRAGRLLRGQATGAAGLTEVIWALDDVSFEVRHGEVVGIIGHNGAGKSTLLKVLSRITEPTRGKVDLYGRVGSLLEVGTGFHPELTGRENIFLNGAILGMSRVEIERKFDEIVAFAEVEKFIDTPVKHYSSGMGLRLGFAVAAHLEPEILVVDEVLAVGDAAFQRKCLGKMGEVAQEGRTVLFVSHNMAAIENLCSRTILLKQGKFINDGPTNEIINEYLSDNKPLAYGNLATAPRPKSSYRPVLQSFNILDEQGEPTATIRSNDPVTFEIKYKSDELTSNLIFAILVHTVTKTPLVFFQTLTHHGPVERWPSEGVLRLKIPALPLGAGTYRLSVECATSRRPKDLVDVVENCAELTVVAQDFFGTGYLPKTGPHGYFLVNGEWEIPAASNGHMAGAPTEQTTKSVVEKPDIAPTAQETSQATAAASSEPTESTPTEGA